MPSSCYIVQRDNDRKANHEKWKEIEVHTNKETSQNSVDHPRYFVFPGAVLEQNS